MRTGAVISSLVLLCALAACAPAATPTPTPQPTPEPTATRIPTPTPLADYVPSDFPRCQGLKELDKALKFAWAGIEEMKIDSGDWYYYHCSEKTADLVAFYRAKMTTPPYNWLENGWVDRPGEGTLGIYFHTARQTWSYVWFLSDPASADGSYLVLSQQGDTPLELPCCK